MTTKIFKLLTLFLLLIICLMVISCGSHGEEEPSGIVGTWVSNHLQFTRIENDTITLNEVYQTEDFVIRFDAGGKGEFTKLLSHDEPYAFTYTNTTLTYVELNDRHEHDIMTISSISGDKLILRYEETTIDGDDVFHEVQLFTFQRKK